jgi:pimeloyl-ACP methyl ester carboxylesterase
MATMEWRRTETGQMTKIAYRRIAVDSIEIFYREAGRSNAPALLLLHGFPTASHMFRDLIPQLADRFHVIAPDLPGFGQSDMPERTKFATPSITSRGLLTASLK